LELGGRTRKKMKIKVYLPLLVPSRVEKEWKENEGKIK